MRIGVTGANGFIGRHLVKQLADQGHEVMAYILDGSSAVGLNGWPKQVFSGNILEQKSLDPFLGRCEVVFHLAAINQYWAADPGIFQKVNIEGTQTLVESCQRHGIQKFVHVSSCITLGASDDPVARSEASDFNLQHVPLSYAHTKKIAEEWVKTQARERGFPAVIVNPVSAIGECDYTPTPIGQAILDICQGFWPVYVEGGSSFVDVHDLVQGLTLAMENGRVGEQYVLGGENLTNREFMTQVSQQAGRRRPRWKVPEFALSLAAHASEWLANHVFKKAPALTVGTRALIGKYLYFDNRKAETELGFRPQACGPAIQRSIDWFRQSGRL